MPIIAVDFDGTIATGCTFPNVSGSYPNRFLIWWLRHRRHCGDHIILWTCRENYGGKWYPNGHYLDDAVSYCRKFGLEFDSVNANVGENWGECGRLYGRKITADLYIDDKEFPIFKKLGIWIICVAWSMMH